MENTTNACESGDVRLLNLPKWLDNTLSAFSLPRNPPNLQIVVVRTFKWDLHLPLEDEGGLDEGQLLGPGHRPS